MTYSWSPEDEGSGVVGGGFVLLCVLTAGALLLGSATPVISFGGMDSGTLFDGGEGR